MRTQQRGGGSIPANFYSHKELWAFGDKGRGGGWQPDRQTGQRIKKIYSYCFAGGLLHILWDGI